MIHAHGNQERKRHFLNDDFRGRWYAGEEEKMSEGEKGVLLAAGIIFLIFYFPGIWFLHESRILPYSQRWFISYTIFYKNAASVPVPYPPNLPLGAGSIKYYYYQGWFDTKSAVSFTVSNEEYQETKET